MGIFAYHIGKMDIPEEHREEYTRQALELLRAGGMMTVEALRLYRKKIYLLSPPEFGEEGRATGYYNYFEKECWEDWWLSTKRGTFGSNKVGGRQFCWAVVAAFAARGAGHFTRVILFWKRTTPARPQEKHKGYALDPELPMAKKPARSIRKRFSAFDLACSSFRSAAATDASESASEATSLTIRGAAKRSKEKVNFVGRFVPPKFAEVELTPEELEEIRKREERKDRLHQNYLKRKASGAQKRYEDNIKDKKKAEMDAKKNALRAEDIARGVFVPVSQLPTREPQKGAQTA